MTRKGTRHCYYCRKEIDDVDQITGCRTWHDGMGEHMAHEACADLADYAAGLVKGFSRAKFGTDYRTLLRDGFTPDAIRRTLHWWYEVRHNDSSKANGGIAIVGHVAADAQEWYDRQERMERECAGDTDMRGWQEFVRPSDKPIRVRPFTRPRAIGYVPLR